MKIYRCPVHGLIESPRSFKEFYDSEPEMVCPINLSTDESGITDDVCDKECEGPFVIGRPRGGPGWTRLARIDALTVGDFIEIDDGYGEVVKISGPHGPLGTPPTTDWYTLRVQFETWDHHIYGFAPPRHAVTVGPLRGTRGVVCWS